MENCIFCKIADHEMEAKIIHEDDDVVAFHDIRPRAPVHVLIIPRKHIPTINDITEDDQELVGKLFVLAKYLAKEFNLSESGYRLVFNCNRDAGQDVYHIHLHLLGGRKMGWPPG